MKVCCDTTFLIDLSRGRRKAKIAYERLFAKHADLYTTFLNAGELMTGAYSLPPDRVEDACKRFWHIIESVSMLGVDKSHIRKTSEIYGALHYQLRAGGIDIPSSDKIIIAIARAHDIRTFLTRDVEHYSRVPGIEVISY
jgi:predicted nucleic acid-binding protein